MKTEEQRKVDFLIGLAKLTRETRIEIGGCGCCGSPFLVAHPESQPINALAGYGETRTCEVAWLNPDDELCDWQTNGASVVREG